MQNRKKIAETIVHDVLKIATKNRSASEILDQIIAHIGKTLESERCYIFETFMDAVHNTHEWVAEGVEAQIDNLQGIPLSQMEGWYRSFQKQEVILIPEVEDIRESEPWIYETLKAQDIHSVAVVALIDKGNVIGFFGLDNPPVDNILQASEMLESLAYFVVSGLRQKHLEARDHGKMLDAMHSTGIYVITQSEHKVLYFNERVKQIAPKIRIGDVCHNIWEGSCDRCPLLTIGDNESCTSINYNDPFGKIVDITATKYLWHNQIPAYIIQVAPHTETVNEHEARNRGLFIETVKEMFFTSFLVNLETGAYESYYEIPHTQKNGDGGSYDDLLHNYLKFVADDFKEHILQNCNLETLKAHFDKGNRQYENIYGVNGLGSMTWVRYIAHVCDTNAEGKATYMTVMLEDITGLRKKELESERAVREALAQAEAANKAKSTFLSNMSHDIRTPMNAIVGYASIAAAHIEETERVKDSLRKILISGEHLQGLLNDVLDMSRIESGKENVNFAKNSLSELIRNAMTMIQSQVQSKRLELYIDTIDITDEMVWMDIAKMRQILVNILGNAVKFTGAGGKISVWVLQTAGSRDGYARYTFKIKDTGIGMSQDFLRKIFDPFEQEHSSATSNIIGTGLGMAICKNLVDLMGGTIEVESELGKGSVFTVCFEWKVEKDAKKIGHLEQLKGYRVLIVDDDFQTCGSVTHMLQEVGMRADWTTSAKEALFRSQLAYSEGDSYFAYIIDWIMPDMNGIELTRQIRKIVGDEIPIIVLTAYYWGDIEKEAKEAGVTSFCTKPLFASDLTDILLQEKAEMMAHEKQNFAGEKILLVEDNELNTEIATFLLEELGFTVQTAENGRIAVNLIAASEEGTYQYVLMDVMMPVMNGLEATKAIRSLEREDVKHLPIIALTANAFKDDVDMCLAVGMDGHLGKPFKKEELVRILAKYQRSCESNADVGSL